MQSAARRSRCRQRVRTVCASRLGTEELCVAIVDELREAIGFAAWGWPLSDPTSLLPTTGIADRGMWPIVARIVDLEERCADVNKDRVLATCGTPVGVLSAATRADLRSSARWREVLGPHGLGDEIRVACVDRFGCWGHLRLYRQLGDAPFAEADEALLHELVPDLAGALRKRAAAPMRAPREAAAEPTTGAVVLDDDLSIRSWTRGAGAWFDAFVGSAPPRGPNARCAVLSTAARAVAGAGVARARMRIADGRWVVAEAARLDGRDTGILVTVRAATTAEVLDFVALSRGLTARERELVVHVVEGLDTRALAGRMGISPHTVQQHLKSVFDKLAVSSRRELVTGLFARPS